MLLLRTASYLSTSNTHQILVILTKLRGCRLFLPEFIHVLLSGLVSLSLLISSYPKRWVKGLPRQKRYIDCLHNVLKSKNQGSILGALAKRGHFWHKATHFWRRRRRKTFDCKISYATCPKPYQIERRK